MIAHPGGAGRRSRRSPARRPTAGSRQCGRPRSASGPRAAPPGRRRWRSPARLRLARPRRRRSRGRRRSRRTEPRGPADLSCQTRSRSMRRASVEGPPGRASSARSAPSGRAGDLLRPPGRAGSGSSGCPGSTGWVAAGTSGVAACRGLTSTNPAPSPPDHRPSGPGRRGPRNPSSGRTGWRTAGRRTPRRRRPGSGQRPGLAIKRTAGPSSGSRRW